SMHAEATNGFYEAPEMQIARAYQSQVTLTDGRIFTIGGSWSSIIIGPGSGEEGNKTGEIYDPATNEWTILEGCPADPMQTA
ncbi:UNVERIFIED_CONTAM: kelch repeat-containing protein, partial [Bacteroidetes bacterium 56_B9]